MLNTYTEVGYWNPLSLARSRTHLILYANRGRTESGICSEGVGHARRRFLLAAGSLPSTALRNRVCH